MGQEDCIDHLGAGNSRRNSINRSRYELQTTTIISCRTSPGFSKTRVVIPAPRMAGVSKARSRPIILTSSAPSRGTETNTSTANSTHEVGDGRRVLLIRIEGAKHGMSWHERVVQMAKSGEAARNR